MLLAFTDDYIPRTKKQIVSIDNTIHKDTITPR